MLRTLFLDLNSYFASVEQQVQPSLRAHPIAVAPITSDSGCCIAASIEAKRFGVKTGMRVGEARRLCPDIAIVDARPRLYVHMHHRVLRAIDALIPVDKVHSIDEVSCRLDRSQRTPEACTALALAIKQSIASRCGVMMRCSIGCAPNRTLAKLGTDLKKPDGLVIFRDEDLPHAIAHLSPQELSGIGPAIMKRLQNAGILTIGDLLARSESNMHDLWGGVLGDRWYHILRGEEVTEPRTRKNSIGHQHVLAPDMRSPEAARSVGVRLLLKAAARMRHENLAAKRISLGLRFQGDEPGPSTWKGPSWDHAATLGDGCTDSQTMLDALHELWTHVPPGTIVQVGVTLSELVPPASLTLPLFTDQSRRENLSRAMDAVNKKFGANKVYTANMHDARTHGSGGIAFNYVPDLAVTDSVQSRQRAGAHPPMSDAEMEALLDWSLTQ